MTGGEPIFFESRYLRSKDEPMEDFCYLVEGASEEDKKEYEEYFNDEYSLRQYRDLFPDMAHPYRLWNGQFIDRGRD